MVHFFVHEASMSVSFLAALALLNDKILFNSTELKLWCHDLSAGVHVQYHLELVIPATKNLQHQC